MACKNLEHGDEILENCEVACTACARCAMDAPGLITMKDNLPVVESSDRGPQLVGLVTESDLLRAAYPEG